MLELDWDFRSKVDGVSELMFDVEIFLVNPFIQA